MTPQVQAALISVAGVMIAAMISAVVATRQSRRSGDLQRALTEANAATQVELEQLRRELQERARRTQRAEDAEEVLKRYREPLAAAAYELQLRLHNILCKDFLGSCGADHERRAKAEETTLFRLAQYFGWSEILRRDIEFLSPPKAPRTQKAVALKTRIADCISGSSGELGLTIWTDEQRAIGELMIVKEHDRVQCMGYARFHQEYDARFAEWCDRLRAELTRGEGRPRLIEVHNLLVDLVTTLDVGVQYTRNLEKITA
jgi:hypothetical protein